MPEIITNKKWVLNQHPTAKLNAEEDLKLVEEVVDLESMILGPDEVAIQTEMFSVDAFIRTMLDADAFHGTVKPGSVLSGVGFGIVVKTGSKESFKIGTRVAGLMQVATLSVANKATVQKMAVIPGVPLSLSIGLLGVSGLTAYFGMFYAPSRGPQVGETVVISAAAGGCGSIAAQLAKLTGAKRVIGIAGGPKKCRFLLDELKLDGAIDYKDTSKTLSEQLTEQCPDGIDFYFDNVGGETLDAVLEKINTDSRIVICGAISQYESGKMYKEGGIQGPSNYIKLAERNSSMVGFTLMKYTAKIINALKAVSYLAWHYYRGDIKSYEHIEIGIEQIWARLGNSFQRWAYRPINHRCQRRQMNCLIIESFIVVFGKCCKELILRFSYTRKILEKLIRYI